MRTTSEMRPTEGSLVALRTDLADLATDDPAGWTDARVHAALPELLTAMNQLTAIVAGVVGIFDDRALSHHDTLRTTRTWLTEHGRMSQGAASAWLHRARLLREMPAVAAHAGQGDVSAEMVRTIGELVERIGAAGARDFDHALAEVASTEAPADLRTVCARIVATVDPDVPDPEPARGWDRRTLTLSRNGSMMRLRGQLDLEGGAELLAALDAVMAPPSDDDLRTPGQRWADALTELAQRVLRSGELASVQGVRPQSGPLISSAPLADEPVAGTGMATGDDAAAPPIDPAERRGSTAAPGGRSRPRTKRSGRGRRARV